MSASIQTTKSHAVVGWLPCIIPFEFSWPVLTDADEFLNTAKFLFLDPNT